MVLPAYGWAQTELKDATPAHLKKITMNDLKYQHSFQETTSSPLRPFRKKSGLAFLSSALIPGTGQAINNKWIRAGSYLLAEATMLTVHFVSLNRARNEQRQYQQFANNNWSVVEYAQWLVEYHDQNGLGAQGLEALRNQVAGKTATFNPSTDWDIVDLEILRQVERNTPFVLPQGIGNNFSHVLPDYGSQQYYELISKYYQFNAGWNDFGRNQSGEPINSLYQLNFDGTDSPLNFFIGAKLAESFNDNYRLAGNMVSFLILNHLVSAFDAFLTVRLKNTRFEADAKLAGAESFTIKYNF